MSLIQAFILGLLQGITEFIPVSSSGHLVLAEYFMGLNLEVDELKTFDVILHGGTLVAILLFFYRDWWGMLKAVWRLVAHYSLNDVDLRHLKYFKILIIATLPAGIAGFLAKDIIQNNFRDPLIISVAMLIVAVVFFLVEKYPSEKNKQEISVINAIVIGCAQAVALLPGVSRSGLTLSAGLGSGISRVKAAKFSFMLAVPIILGANILVLLGLTHEQNILPSLDVVLTGFITSALVGLICIKFLLDFFQKHTLKMFAFYLIVLSMVIFGIFANGNIVLIKQIIIDLLVSFFRDWGYLVVFLSAFVEAVPLLGIIIPGGTIIILSGVFALETSLNIYILILCSSLGAIMGDFTGFLLGKKYGEEFLIKYGPRIGFKEEYLYVTHRFCHQYGGFALIIGRFNNIVRPFIPMVVGSSQMKIYKFWFFNVIGGIAWSVFSVLIGYFARQSWDIIQKYVGLGGGVLFTGMFIGAFLIIKFEVDRIRKRKLKKRLLGTKQGGE
jgi:undecaprenyl-diphosphatase